ALLGGGLRAAASSRLTLTMVILLTLATVGAGVGAFAPQAWDNQAAAQSPPSVRTPTGPASPVAAPQRRAPAAPVKPEGAAMTVRGRVLDADGKAAAGVDLVVLGKPSFRPGIW